MCLAQSQGLETNQKRRSGPFIYWARIVSCRISCLLHSQFTDQWDSLSSAFLRCQVHCIFQNLPVHLCSLQWFSFNGTFTVGLINRPSIQYPIVGCKMWETYWSISKQSRAMLWFEATFEMCVNDSRMVTCSANSQIAFKPNGQYISYMIASQESNKNMLGSILYFWG